MMLPAFGGDTGQMLCSEHAAGEALPSAGTNAADGKAALGRASP